MQMRRRENEEGQQSARRPERWQHKNMRSTISANLEALGDTSDQIVDVRDNGLKMEKMRQCNQREETDERLVALQKIPKARPRRKDRFQRIIN